MLALPECFEWVGSSKAESLAFAKPLGHDLVRQYQQLAAEHQIILSLGGFHEKREGRVSCSPTMTDQARQVKIVYATHI